MSSPRGPDHSRSASLVLPEEAAETGHSTPTRKAIMVNESRTQVRFWLGLAAFLAGLALLAIGLIFFPTRPGTLAAEIVGSGVALLTVCVLLVSGVWRPVSAQQVEEVVTPEATPERAVVSASTVAPSQPAPSPPIFEPDVASQVTPPAEQAPEPSQASVSQETASAVAGAASITTSESAPEQAPAAPADKGAARKRSKAAKKEQDGHPGARRRAPTKASSQTEPRLPALTNLPQSFPPFADRTLIDVEAEDLGELLGDIAEQSAMAMLTRGQRGAQRRERLAARIEAFRQEMARDPEYAPVAAFLEAVVGLLRAGTPIPAPTSLVEPFDGLYEYTLKLIRRKSRMTHDE